MAFYFEDIGNVKVMRSSLMDRCGVKHGFSTRHGGVSEAVHTSSMSIGFGRGDDNETVIRNVEIFLSALNIEPSHVISVPQIHSKEILTIEKNSDLTEFQGLGVYRKSEVSLDGYVTDSNLIAPMVKIADCVPVLMCDPVNRIISAVHSGWKGTAMQICIEAVEKMESLGAVRKNIVCAVGACIHKCCYEVADDFYSSVAEIRGGRFAETFIKPRIADGERIIGKYSADISGMIVKDLTEFGIPADNIDTADECTCCDTAMFHSHRASKGLRGTMGAVISLEIQKKKSAFIHSSFRQL